MPLDPSADPSSLPDFDDDLRKLHAAGLLAGQSGPGSPVGASQAQTPQAPALSTQAPPVPKVPGMGGGADAYSGAPSAPKQPSYAAPDLTGGSGFGGVPKQPSAASQGIDPALQSTGYTPMRSLIPGVPDHDPAHEAGLLPGVTAPKMRDTFGATQSASQTGAPSAKQTAKAYTVGDDGVLSLKPTNLVNGLLDANRDGLIDNDKLKSMLPSAIQAEKAAADQASLQQRVSADDWAKGKAYAHGAAGGLSFIAGAAPGAVVGGNIGTAAGGVVGAALTPFVGPEVIPPLMMGGRILGSVVGGLAGGKATENVAKTVGDQLAQHSATIKSFSDAAQVHPGYDQAGQLTAFLIPAGGAMRNLSKVGELAGGGTAGAKAIANRVLLGAGAGAAFEGAARPAFDATVNAGKDALGIEHEGVQAPSVGSVAQNAALGMLLAGHGIEFNRIGADELGLILNRGEARIQLNVAHNEAIPAEKLARFAEQNPGVSQEVLTDIAKPLSNAEREVFFRARDKANELATQGIKATGSAEQATQGGQPIGAASVDVRPADSPPATSPAPATLRLGDGAAGLSTPAAFSPASQPPGQPPVSSGPPAFVSPTGTSPSATAPAAPGQAQQRDDDTLAALRQTRDGFQALLDGGKISPEAREATQAQVDMLTRHIDAVQPQPPPAPNAPAPSSPASTSPAAPPPAPPVAGTTASISMPGASDVQDSTKAQDASVQPAAAVTDDHRSLGNLISRGAETDQPGLPASPAYQILKHLDSNGVAVTPELASAVSTQVDAARAQNSSGNALFAALRDIGRQHLEDNAPPGTSVQKDKYGIHRIVPDTQPGNGPSNELVPSANSPARESNQNGQPVTGQALSSGEATPTGQDQNGAAITDRHEAMASMVNSGASSDHGQGQPSTAFVVLQRIKARGAEVTPDVARNVSENVTDILEDSGISDEEKQAQLKQLIRDHVPATPATATAPESTTAPAMSAADARAPETTTTSVAVTPDTAAPAPLAVGDKIDVAKNGSLLTISADDGGPTITATTSTGQAVPVPRDMAVRGRVEQAPAAPTRAVPDLRGGDTQALANPTVGNASAIPDATSTEATRPVTPAGQSAQRTVDALTAQGALTPTEQNALRNARTTLDRELNRQVLGANPQPTTDAGRDARQQIQRFQEAQNAGARLEPSQHAAWSNHLAVLENDFTRQRQAIEAQAGQPGEVSASSASPSAPAGPSASPAPAPTPAPAATRPLAVGDKAKIGGLPLTVAELPAGNGPVVMKTSGGKELRLPRQNVLAKRLPDAPPAAPAGADAPVPAVPAVTSIRKGQEFVHQGRPAVVEKILGDKAVVRVKAGPSPTNPGVNLIPKRVHVSLDRTAAQIGSAKQGAPVPASPTAPTVPAAAPAQHVVVPRQPGDTDSVGVAREWLGDQRRMGKSPTAFQVHKAGRIPIEKARAVLDDQRAAEAKASVPSKPGVPAQPPAPFKRPSRAAVARQSQITRGLEKAAQANPEKAGVVEKYQAAAKSLAEMHRQRALPLQEGETPRSFSMPHAPTGNADVLDHIVEQGGVVSPSAARKQPTFDKRAGDYDGAPTLGGYYQHAVYGGRQMPDRMAQTLHENYGVGDGSPDGMWKAVQQAVDLRKKVATQQQNHALAEKQASNFEKAAVQPATARGKTEINTSNLNVGDRITVGDQTLKVAAVDEDSFEVTLEDHSKFGVQQVADGKVLFVEKVLPAAGSTERLGAATPDRLTGSLFGEDEPFALRPETGPDAERVAAARQLAKQSAPPQLRAGEKGTGDLFQGADQPFNLAGERGVDHGERQAEQQRQAQESADAQAKQNREQGSLFTPLPERGPISAEQAQAVATSQIDANMAMLKRQGVRRLSFGETEGGSGVEYGGDGTLYIDPAKVAKAMETVRDNWRAGTEGTPHQWFAQVLAHERIHVAQVAVAHAKGQTVQQRYDSLPTAALPSGWQEAGRESYGKGWDSLPEWQQKVEFERMVIEQRWTGKITEQLYKFIKEAIKYLKNLAGFENADPAFKESVAEVEARLEAAQSEGDHAPPRDRDADSKQLDFTTVPATEAKPAAEPSALATSAGKKPGGIADFGEKIEGARKDRWGKFGRAMQEGLPAHAVDITLSKHFPEPDYEKLIADGVSERDLATMKALRDMIPPKPQSPYKLKAWGDMVRGLHEAMKQLVSPDGSVTSEKADTILSGSRQIANRVNLYRELGYPAFSGAKDWTLKDGHFTTFMGRDYRPGKTIAYAEHKGRMQMDISSDAPTATERTADVARQIKARIDATTALPPQARETHFAVYTDRYTNEAFIGKKGPNGVVRVKTGFKTAKEALDYRDANKEELAAKWEEMKQPPNLRRAANNPREGIVRHEGDVAPGQFQDAFGFRGVQFGNYVEGPRRQADLNEAFDALTDLAETLGIPTKALSLDGSLGLAFGARGGGTAKAHYEPGQVVINLTKTQGPGSLAHEWFHALDNYFARLDRTGDTAPKPVDGYGTRDSAPPKNIRPEVWQAFKGIRDMVSKGDFARRSNALDATRSKPYYGTTIEKAARAFETYVEERLAKTGISNDYLVNIDKAGSDAYPTTPELDGGIRAAFDHLFNTLDTKPTERGSMLYAAEPEAVPAPHEQTPDPKRVSTIKELVDESLLPSAAGASKRFVQYATVNPEQAAQLKADTGLDLDGYRRNITNSAVRHVWKNHGDPAKEIARGNAPLAKEDFEKLPQLLEKPDASILAGKNPLGQDVILSAKRVNGHYIIAEEVRGNKVLNLSTVYKKSAPPLADDAVPGGPTPPLTPEAIQSAARDTLQQLVDQHKFLRGESQNAPTTYDNVRGAKINRLRTAFSPQSGTLGIPRSEMPQIASEHRGAAANFLDARGMPFQATEVRPDSLKPSQADFNPGKVAKAGAIREAGDANARRILVSSDGHVIDGHHQWLDRLENAPDRPMPALRIDAPARDILRQIHEFPSAGMEKAPDIGERIVATGKPDEPANHTAAREWLATQRAAGLDPKWSEITPKFKVSANTAKQIVADQDRAEHQHAPHLDADTDDARLGAAEPEPVEGAEETGYRGIIDRLRDAAAGVQDKLAQARAHNATAADIRAGKYAAETRAGISGEQAGEAIRLRMPDALDQRAAVPIVESGGNRAALEAQLAKVKASADPKLAAEYAPIYQHALDNLDRLHGHEATAEHRNIRAQETSDARNAGLENTPWQPYVEHVLDDPSLGQSIVTDKGLGQVPGHATYADAIHAGVDPKGGMNLPDVTERMVRQNRMAINGAEFRDTVAKMKAGDGKPVLDAIQENASKTNPDGSLSSAAKVPRGYEAVQAGEDVLTVHKEFAPLFKAMYGDSAVRQYQVGRAMLKTAAFAKHNTLVFESYHLCRLAARGLGGYGITGYKDDLAGFKYRMQDLDKAVESGAINKEQAKAVRDSYEVDDKLVRGGLPVGQMSDNLMADPHMQGLFNKLWVVGPLAARFNKWMFGEVQRSYVRQAGRITYERIKARNPQMSDEAVVRQAVKETGEFFGNPAHTSFITSRTMQDVANIVGFSPKWTEGTLKAELRGIGQAAKIPLDLLRGRRPQVGNAAQALGTVVLASVIGTQMLNLLTRHQTTWQNSEDDHKWDAWLPGGPQNRGFWFSPLSIAAEFTHGMKKYMEGGANALDAAVHIASNKLSGPARGAKDLLTGEDWRGQPFASMGERLKAAAVDTLPSPLPLSGVLAKDPKAMLGYGLNHQPGSLIKQGLSAVGMKVDNAKSARAQMYDVARPYRPAGSATAQSHLSTYGALKHAADNEDQDATAAEIMRLVTKEGHTLDHLLGAVGWKGDMKKPQPEYYTGDRDGDMAMAPKLSPEQRRLYLRAQEEHAKNAVFIRHTLAVMLKDPDTRRVLSLASTANRRGNKGLAKTLGTAGTDAP